MKNFKLTISYDGSRYSGWERQPGRDTIQGKLETVLSRMVNAEVNVIGAGRTDAGVHARAMVANCYLETELQPDEIRDYMNRYLPDDICVDEVKLAADRFHARYRAVGKLYTYTCYVGATKPVFNRKYVTTLDYVPDVAAMQRAAEILTGEHDFKSFCSNPQMKKSTVRTVDSIEIVRKKDYIYFNFHGTGFLQNMVRILVGTLLEVGQGKRTIESVQDTLDARDRTTAGYTAPPQGLSFLMAKNRRMRAVLAEQLLFFISREEELLIRMRDSCPPEGTGFPGAGGRIRFSPHGGNLLETFLRRNTGKLFLYRKMPVKFGSALFVHMVHGSFHIAAFQAG